jgi:acyl carrier protein
MPDLRQALRRHLAAAFGIKAPFDDATDLFASGVVDSLGVMDLVSFVEEQTGLAVPPAAITLENFGSIERIERFARALAATGGGR